MKYWTMKKETEEVCFKALFKLIILVINLYENCILLTLINKFWYFSILFTVINKFCHFNILFVLINNLFVLYSQLITYILMNNVFISVNNLQYVINIIH